MNENLKRLQELVRETNEVVANLNQETEDIKAENNLVRAKKFKEIRDFLFECYDIVKELNATVRVPINIPNMKVLGYDASPSIQIGYSEKEPVRAFLSYVDKRGDLTSETGYALKRDAEWKPDQDKQYMFGCWFNTKNENDFVDKWDQAKFERSFAAQIETKIIERSNAANEKYHDAINRAEMLKEEQ